jgi:hypothetical protein
MTMSKDCVGSQDCVGTGAFARSAKRSEAATTTDLAPVPKPSTTPSC